MSRRVRLRLALMVLLAVLMGVLVVLLVDRAMGPPRSSLLGVERVERMRPPGFDSFTAHEQAAFFRAICEAGFTPDLMRPLGLYPGFPSRKPFIECRAL